jgi:hypothetical protein
MRIALVACVLLAGCASAPPPPAPQPSAPPSSTADAQDEANLAERRFAEAARSYQVVERNGRPFYCRNERPTGSKLNEYVCISESELRQRIEDEERLRRRTRPVLTRPAN